MNKEFRAFNASLCAVVVWMCLFSARPARADTLDISIAAQGGLYNSMVHDAKLRGDGLPDWNLGGGSAGSNRFYANFEADGTTINADGGGRKNNFVQWFDVSSIPAGSIINSATLTVVLGRGANSSSGGQTYTNVKLSRLLPGKDWVEVNVGGDGPHTDGSVTWNHQAATTIAWDLAGATGGGDITGLGQQTFNIVGTTGVRTTVVRTITDFVQFWVDNPSSNEGLVWWAGNRAPGDGRFFHFGTKEDALTADLNFGQAPSLVIDYTPGGSPVAPIIDEVTPDPDHNTFANVPYVKQLTLTQGTFPITWSVLAGSPAGTAVDSTGNVTGWTPTTGNIGSTFTINIRATNAQGFDDESWQATVHAVTPVIAEVTPDPGTAVSGNPYVKQLSLTQGTAPIVWSVIQGPPGTAVDSTGNVTGWTPGPGDINTTVTFEIKASNEGAYGATFGGNDTETWQVEVPPSNNGFSTDSVFVVRNPDNGGQVREFDKLSAPPGTIINSEFLPDGSIWQSITFSGVGSGNDARMFVAKPNAGRTDIEIAEIDYQAATVNSTTLGAIINASVGSNIAFGNIRYSNLSNTLFVSLNPDETTTSTAVCYEIPLSLAANSRIHTYVGEIVPPTTDVDPAASQFSRVTVAINRRDGTLYMAGQHLGDATESGLGDVITFATAGRVVGGTTSSFSVLIDGQTCNAGNSNYIQPSTVIYRQRGGNDDTLLIPTNLGSNTSVLEFYLNTSLHPVDGNGNLAQRIGLSLTIGRGWNGQQDIGTGDIWLGAKHYQCHFIRTDDTTGAFESPTRSWFDAAVAPAPSLCPNEPVADFDSDGDVDMDDFGEFQKCYTGQLVTPVPLTGYCHCIDFDGDDDIDSTDFNAFADCETGAGVLWVTSVQCPG